MPNLRSWAAAAALSFASCTPAPKPVTATRARPALAERVRGEIRHAWQGYVRHAWGHDDLKPLSRTWHDWYGEPLLMTPVDSLDTLLIAGLAEEAERAHRLVLERLSFDKDMRV